MNIHEQDARMSHKGALCPKQQHNQWYSDPIDAGKCMARSARNPPCRAVAAVARNDISRRIGGEIEKGDESLQ